MKNFKITVMSAFAFTLVGTASFAIDDNPPPPCDCEEPAGGNPGNAKPVGNSPWDGITGNSGNNNPGPRATPMNGQRSDNPYAQPGGKGNGPSNANK